MKARENTDEVKTCLPWIWCAMATPSIRTTHDIAVVMARIRPSPVVASCLMRYRFSIESASAPRGAGPVDANRMDRPNPHYS